MQRMPAAFAAQAQARNAAAINAGTRVLTGRPYYSHARVSAVRSGAGPAFTYTIAQGTILKFFAYRIGELMTVAGRAADTATLADTNLYVASQTIDSEIVDIRGIMLQLVSPGAQSDPLAAVNALRDISVSVAFNGSQRQWDLGNCEMIPGGSGFFTPAACASISSGGTVGAASLGMPEFMNFYPILGGIKWNPASNSDSSLIVKLTVERPVVFNISNAAAPATTSFDLRCQLVSRQDAKRSVNA
jgi:hypothetical protein